MKRIVRRVWPAAVWLGVWQAGSMAFAAIYPHGALLLASPLASLKALCGMAGTAAFWTAVLRSTLCIWGGWLAGCLLAVVLAAGAGPGWPGGVQVGPQGKAGKKGAGG